MASFGFVAEEGRLTQAGSWSQLATQSDISNADEVCPSFVIKEWKRLGLFCRKADSKGSFTKLVPDPGTPTLPRRSSVSRYLILYLINLGFEGPAPEYFRIIRAFMVTIRILYSIKWV